MTDPARIHDADGWRRIEPSQRSPGLTELRLPNDRCIAAIGVGAEVENSIMEKARNG
jgi:hypothetical protein